MFWSHPGRLAVAAATLTVGLVAWATAIPTAFAQEASAGLYRRAPVALVRQAA